VKRVTSLLPESLWRIGWVAAVMLGSGAAALACAQIWGFQDFGLAGASPTDDATTAPDVDEGDDSPADSPPDESSSADANVGPECSAQSFCKGRCLDTTSDPNNCGGCDACPFFGEICVASTCSCPSGYHLCTLAGVCAMDTDPTLCGPSCTVCPGAVTPKSTNGGAHCVSGVCEIICDYPTLTACVSGPDSGDCFDLSMDTSHCGSCDAACPTPAFGSATCAGTPPKCGISCDKDYTMCVSDAGAASCAYPMNDPLNCGSCGHQCPGADAGKGFCKNGACE
jgi:hypothetical protein